jgi:poly(3-hydroxybutyrate) depolymerase
MKTTLPLHHAIFLRWTLLLISGFLLTIPAFSQQSSRKLVTKGTNGAPFGYFEYLPTGYSPTSEKKPLIVYLHGAGELGNGSSDLYKMKQRALPKLLQNGKEIPFVVIAPQAPSWWHNHDILPLLEWIKSTYNIDPGRIYLTGISMGGTKCWDFASKNPDKITAVCPMGADARYVDACKLSRSMPVWAFHGSKDHVYSASAMTAVINKMNTQCNPKANPAAKGTVYGNHGHDDLWDHVYNVAHGDNLYKWMLQYRKGTTSTTNKAPIANAGPDITISLSQTSVQIKGTGSDYDGSISKYRWNKISGPYVKMSKMGSSTLTASELVAGTYEFELAVTDNKGAVGRDRMKLTVHSSSTTNKAPVANAGSDITITLPKNSVYIKGSGTDSDGSISKYYWTKVSGPAAKMGYITTATMYAYALSEGTYEFELTVTDNKGATAKDRVRVYVKKSGSTGGTTVAQGLNYKYYEGNWTALPNFGSMQAKKSGKVTNFSLAPRNRADYFGFVFDGYIKIATAGTYTFYTTSDDGSKLYIGGQQVVNNDGLHGAVEKSGSIYLKAGSHPIKVAYFERYGGETLLVSYSGPGISKRKIPDAVLSTGSSSSSTSTLAVSTSWEEEQATEESFAEAVQLVNNPVHNGVLHLSASDDASLQEGEVMIYDNTGRRYSSLLRKSSGLQQWEVATEHLHPGIYVVLIEQQDGTRQRIRFIQR